MPWRRGYAAKAGRMPCPRSYPGWPSCPWCPCAASPSRPLISVRSRANSWLMCRAHPGQTRSSSSSSRGLDHRAAPFTSPHPSLRTARSVPWLLPAGTPQSCAPTWLLLAGTHQFCAPTWVWLGPAAGACGPPKAAGACGPPTATRAQYHWLLLRAQTLDQPAQRNYSRAVGGFALLLLLQRQVLCPSTRPIVAQRNDPSVHQLRGGVCCGGCGAKALPSSQPASRPAQPCVPDQGHVGGTYLEGLTPFGDSVPAAGCGVNPARVWCDGGSSGFTAVPLRETR